MAAFDHLKWLLIVFALAMAQACCGPLADPSCPTAPDH
jgi:hypothetical protein